MAPVVTALNLPSDKNFFYHCDKDLYLLFFPRWSLILLLVFLHLNFFRYFSEMFLAV